MKSFYSKKFFLFVRLVSVFFIGYLLYNVIHAVKDVFIEHYLPCTIGLIIGTPSLIILLFIFFKPERLALFVPSLFYFGIINAVSNSNPTFPIIFFELGIIILWIRGFFKTKKVIKAVVIAIIYLTSFLSALRYGWNEFYPNLLEAAQILLITGSIIFLLHEYLKTQTSKDTILNIADYSELTERDAKWLESVQQGVKYEAIAIDYELTLGTVQNRLNKIYRILETGDRIGFLSIYSNAKIVYKK